MRLTDIEINNYYLQAVQDFKVSHPEWICTIKDGFLIIQLNAFSWKTYYGYQLESGQRRFRHIVIISKNGMINDFDMFVSEENVIGLGETKVSRKMFLGESGSYSYRIPQRKGSESGFQQDQQELEFSEFNVQKIVVEYFKTRGLRFFSPTRLITGISFMFFPLVLGMALTSLIGALPLVFWEYLAVFFLMGLYLVVTCRQILNPLKIAGMTFMGVALAFLAIFPMLPDLFMKLIFGFFVVLFLPMGLAIYISGVKESF
jgi:hypothetical protein